jgi:hypothetical protein
VTANQQKRTNAAMVLVAKGAEMQAGEEPPPLTFFFDRRCLNASLLPLLGEAGLLAGPQSPIGAFASRPGRAV